MKEPVTAKSSAKRRGRPSKVEPDHSGEFTEMVKPEPSKEPTREEQCREALKALAAPRMPDYAGIVAPFREEVQAARAAGRGWDAIADVLKKHGYNIGGGALKTVIEKGARA